MKLFDQNTSEIAAAAASVLEGKVDEAALSAKKRLDMYKNDYGIDAHGMKDAKEAEKVIRFMFTTQKDLTPEQMKALVDAGFFKEGIKQNQKLRRTTANMFGNNAWIQQFDYKAFMKKKLKEEVELDEAIDASDYTVGAEKTKKGYRPMVKHTEKGHTMYMAGVSYKDEKTAVAHAQAYLDAYAARGDRAANNAVADFRKKNAKNVVEVAEPEAQGEKDFKAKHAVKKVGRTGEDDDVTVDEEQEVYESCGKVHEGACSESVDESVKNEESDKQKKYQAFFQKALKKFGVNSPQELEKDKRAEFFDYVDANYEADNETD